MCSSNCFRLESLLILLGILFEKLLEYNSMILRLVSLGNFFFMVLYMLFVGIDNLISEFKL